MSSDLERESTEAVPPWQVIRDYQAVLERHKGKAAAPFSDLPHSPKDICNALYTAARRELESKLRAEFGDINRVVVKALPA